MVYWLSVPVTKVGIFLRFLMVTHFSRQSTPRFSGYFFLSFFSNIFLCFLSPILFRFLLFLFYDFPLQCAQQTHTPSSLSDFSLSSQPIGTMPSVQYNEKNISFSKEQKAKTIATKKNLTAQSDGGNGS